jgi:septal ring factor EnvC (AmiA/AmiB activator)
MREEFTNKINNKQDQISELREKIKKQDEEISQLYKVIADAKTMIETQSGTILSMSDSIRNLQKKLSKQPMVYSDKTFIS